MNNFTQIIFLNAKNDNFKFYSFIQQISFNADLFSIKLKLSQVNKEKMKDVDAALNEVLYKGTTL